MLKSERGSVRPILGEETWERRRYAAGTVVRRDAIIG